MLLAGAIVDVHPLGPAAPEDLDRIAVEAANEEVVTVERDRETEHRSLRVDRIERGLEPPVATSHASIQGEVVPVRIDEHAAVDRDLPVRWIIGPPATTSASPETLRHLIALVDDSAPAARWVGREDRRTAGSPRQ